MHESDIVAEFESILPPPLVWHLETQASVESVLVELAAAGVVALMIGRDATSDTPKERTSKNGVKIIEEN